MLYYLNNNDSKSGPANENYARELFELHTLGADSYLNSVYNKWKQVPGAIDEKPIGYIDQDVYEAARAFTGWTVGDGARLGHQERMPETGDFFYYEAWHDNYQKRVLGVEFESNQPPLSDGKLVLDLVAKHPATATHLCKKLCLRFIGEEVPETFIAELAKVWMDNNAAKDQIAKVLSFLLNSEAYKTASAKKVKRPPELMMSFLRAINADIVPHQSLYYLQIQMGYKPFAYPSPTGHPDTNGYWISSNMMLQRWNAIIALLYNKEAVTYDLVKQNPTHFNKAIELQTWWYERLCGVSPDANAIARLNAINRGIPLNEQTLKQTIAFIGASPAFQYR